VEQQSENLRSAQGDSPGEDQKANCTRARLARIVTKTATEGDEQWQQELDWQYGKALSKRAGEQ
jgi:hypothetical protein